MKKLLILPVLALALSACSGGLGTAQPAAINVTGTWDGTITVQGGNTTGFVLDLVQGTDGSITGNIIDTDDNSSLPVTGTVAGGDLNFSLPDSREVLKGTYTNTTYSGAFVAYTDKPYASGTFSFIKRN